MVKKEFGLRSPKSSVKPIFGYTDSETVMLDLDDKSFKFTKYWALIAMKRFKLDGFVILKSSPKHYHVVFDCPVSWENNMSVVGWVAVLSKSVSLLRWLAMQCIKKASTLRVSVKGEKPSPRVVYRFGEQDHAVKEFLKKRRRIKQISRLIG
jgi:hypothetical protein